MSETTRLPTEFAPAERASDDVVRQQFETIYHLPFAREFLDAIPNMSVVLNRERQIVFANKAFLEFLGEDSFEEVLGKRQGEVLNCHHLFGPIGMRPGEAVNCVHARESGGGCGTTLFCRNCGAVRSILQSQEEDELSIEECSMIRRVEDEERALDLRVWSRPIDIDGESFTVFSVVDISDEKRRRVLERIFFHDVLNTAGGLQGLADILASTDLKDEELNEIAQLLYGASSDLIEEINAQRILSAAETGELELHPERLDSINLLNTVRKQFASHEAALDKNLVLDSGAEEIAFRGDYQLIRRVLLNLIKNALEASAEGDSVTLSCRKENGSFEFTVHNPAVMPLDVQLQIFNRSFSTKGANRGIGTYSIKLLTERYLRGRVSFMSSEGSGTVFKIILPRNLPPA